MRKRGEAGRGFTLIEVVVVVGVIAILTAIALPLFFANKERAIWAQAKANLDAVRSALAAYNANSLDDIFPGPATNDYQQVRVIVPEANLPPDPAQAGWDPSLIRYSVSGEAKWYTFEVKVGNRHGDVIVGTPSGVAPTQYPH